jgi:putative salt-induced outer membrane protein YdiY
MLLSVLLFARLFTQPIIVPDQEPDIVALEQQLFRAIEERNRDALERLIAPDFVLRGNPDTSRGTWISGAVTLCWGPRWDLQQLIVRDEGETQVASFILNFYRDPLTCRPAFLRSLITDVWARRDGRWQLTVRHAGPVGDATPRAQYGPAPLVPAFESRAEFSFVSTGGNSSTETVGFAGDTAVRRGRATTTGRATFVRTSTDDQENARSLTALARHSVRLSDRIEAYGRGGFLRDLFAGIEERITADAGLSYVVPQPYQRALKFDLGFGFTQENRVIDEDQSILNATAGTTVRARLNPMAEVTAEAVAVADVEKAANWRVATDVSLNALFTPVLSARFAYSLRYVHQPVPGFLGTDHTLTAALVFRYVRPQGRRP